MTRPSGSLSGHLWSLGDPTYRAVLGHLFLSELSAGTLDPTSFAFYLTQDKHYIATFARCFSLLAARAPDSETARILAAQAVGPIADEEALHAMLVQMLVADGICLADVAISPSTFAYGNHLIRLAALGSFAQAISAVLPCCWMYGEVGKVLAQTGSPHPIYALWVKHYGSADFDRTVFEVLAMCDRAGAAAPTEVGLCEEAYLTSARYEWMLWDDAYHQRVWPI